MYIAGALFWTAFILTVGMAVRINKSRHRSELFNREYEGLKKIGLLHFFQNKEALVMDAMMFTSLIVLIIIRVLKANVTVQSLFISLFVFSFGMHCMLNGINYVYIKYKTEVRRD